MNRHLFFISFMAFALLLGGTSMARAQSSDDESYTLLSQYKVDDAKIDDAIDLFSKLQLAALEGEYGCVIYDIMLSDDDASIIFVYESYDSEAEFNKYIKSKNYNDIFAKKIKPMLKESKVTKVFLLNFEEGYSED